MASTGEIWVLNKLADLTNRYGVSPVAADISLDYIPVDGPEGQDDSYYFVQGMDGAFANPAEETKIRKIWSLLGLDGRATRRFDTLEELEEVVDQALCHAPRARPR